MFPLCIVDRSGSVVKHRVVNVALMDFGLQFCLVRREVVDASFRLIQTSRAATVDLNLPNCVASADPRGHIYIYITITIFIAIIITIIITITVSIISYIFVYCYFLNVFF